MNARLEKLHNWIQAELNIQQYELKPASEDASFRRYYRLRTGEATSIIMDAPPEKENCKTFLEIARRLHDAGVHVPEVLSVNIDDGFIQISDLGDALYLDQLNNRTADSLYKEAINSLVRIQQSGDYTGMPAFDREFLMGEMQLFANWLLSSHLHVDLSGQEQSQLQATFEFLVKNALEQPQVFVHRDYHSRNLMVTAVNNPGILDFQDAMRGPVSYDLVSLLKDCYIKWPKTRISAWALQFYRQQLAEEVSQDRFARWFDLMGVQRHLKASGIFARLYHRDQKAGFLKDIPRTLSYITDMVGEYPELEFLVSIITTRVSPVLEETNKTCGP